MSKKISLLIVIVSFFVFTSGVDATTLRDLTNELAALEKSYQAAQNKANMSQAEMNRVKASIANTEQEIKQAQNDITQAENDIVKSEKEIEEKKEETNQMLLYLQLMNTGGNSMLEYVFDADDYTDFIYRYAVVSQMSEHNNTIMDDLKSLVEQLTTKKQELAAKQVDLSKKKSDLQAKYVLVQAQYKSDHDDGLGIADQIKQKKQRISSLKSAGCTMDQNINTCSGIAAVDGWVYPLARFYQSSSYAEARGSIRHYAVDLAIPEGNTVRAVANGKVIAKYSSTCGGLVIQIQHNYNGSNYVSLYMHMIDGFVNYNQSVTAGQPIGTSGGGSREIAKWGDRCTGGPHLHFAMSYGDAMINSSSRKDSTFDPVKFFPAMRGEGARYNY